SVAFSFLLWGDASGALRHNERDRRTSAGAWCARSPMETAPSVPLPALRDDAELVRLCVRGDVHAFRELTERYYRPICGFLFKRLRQPDLVEDLAQETFLEAYRALKQGRIPEKVSGWRSGIAVNRGGKWLRRRKPSLFPADDPPDTLTTPFVSPEEELEEQRKRQTALEDGLAGVSDDMRTLLDMKHRQGKT